MSNVFSKKYVDLFKPEESLRAKNIAVAMANSGLVDMSSPLLPRPKSWLRDGRTWIMRHGDQLVHSQTNYFLWTDQCLYQNTTVQNVGQK